MHAGLQTEVEGELNAGAGRWLRAIFLIGVEVFDDDAACSTEGVFECGFEAGCPDVVADRVAVEVDDFPGGITKWISFEVFGVDFVSHISEEE